jgi:hypothetical protein
MPSPAASNGVIRIEMQPKSLVREVEASQVEAT